MELDEAFERLRSAIRGLILEQWELAALDLGERTVTSHLFCHVVDAYHGTGYDVDHEYNRQFDLTKHLTFEKGDELGEHRVFPDLVIHRRNRDDSNLVAVEVKKGMACDGDDCEKVRALTLQPDYRYRFGLLLALGMERSRTLSASFSGGPYFAWEPRWEWLAVSENGDAEIVISDTVFFGDEAASLNRKGWLNFPDRLNAP